MLVLFSLYLFLLDFVPLPLLENLDPPLIYETDVLPLPSPDNEHEIENGVRVLAAAIQGKGPDHGEIFQFPFAVDEKTASVSRGRAVQEIQVLRGVGPGSELQGAFLLVEGEVVDVDLAGAAEDSRCEPGDDAIVGNGGVGFHGSLERAVGAVMI